MKKVFKITNDEYQNNKKIISSSNVKDVISNIHLDKKDSETVVAKDQVETCEKMKTALEQYRDLVKLKKLILFMHSFHKSIKKKEKMPSDLVKLKKLKLLTQSFHKSIKKKGKVLSDLAEVNEELEHYNEELERYISNHFLK